MKKDISERTFALAVQIVKWCQYGCIPGVANIVLRRDKEDKEDKGDKGDSAEKEKYICPQWDAPANTS